MQQNKQSHRWLGGADLETMGMSQFAKFAKVSRRRLCVGHRLRSKDAAFALCFVVPVAVRG